MCGCRVRRDPRAPEEYAIYRGRFAPTPSGPLHFGSIVAAVGSYLEARTRGGEWHLRIDDLDPPRVVPGATDSILRCLEQLGFEWDGPVICQSGRTPAYHAALHRLRQRGLVYPCACSRKEIAEHAPMGAEGPVYPGTCRAAMPAHREARTLRLRTAGVRIEFDDAVLGPQTLDIEHEAGDFVLYRADAVFAFHLASAVDDCEFAMTDIVRGADLLESSARQIYVMQRLGLPAPRYAHLPVAVNARGEKLSKQTHADAIDPREPGRVLFGALRFLGQSPPEQLSGENARVLWDWATTNWCLERVPKTRSPPRRHSIA
jgi:glutamyl-Q tRNA(Asp) synthetase